MRSLSSNHVFRDTAMWLAWLLPLFAWAPLAYPGSIAWHSGFTPVFNLNDLLLHVGDLTWTPALWQPYDLWRGERFFPYLLAILPRVLGTPPSGSIKLVFALFMVLGSVGMFGWARRYFGAWPALVAATAYAYWPLGLATVYVRGAVAEAAILALAPLAFWAADATLAGKRSWPAAGLALVIAAAFWTQSGLAIWLSVLLLSYIVVVGRVTGQPLRYCLAGFGIGLVLGLVAMLPLLIARGSGGPTYVNFSEHLVYPHQLIAAAWGTGPSIPGPSDTLTFQLGLIACGLALLSLLPGDPGTGSAPTGEGAIWLAPTHVATQVGILMATAIAVLVFLSSTLSGPIWRTIPVASRTLTYPWQLLLLTGPLLTWLSAMGSRRLFCWLPEGVRPVAAPALLAGMLTLALLGSYAYLRPVTTAVTPPDRPLAVLGSHEIALLEAAPSGTPGPGSEVQLKAVWQALRPVEEDYTVFFHIVDGSGRLWGQEDTKPVGGERPTPGWLPGEIVQDAYSATLQAGAPAGIDYLYHLGMYQLESGERLSADGDDKVILEP